MKFLIFTHGLDVEEKNWRAVVRGVPPYQLGRATQSLYAAWRMFPESDLAFGSGKNSKHPEGRVVTEAEYTREYMLQMHENISEFEAFKDLRPVQSRWLRQKLDTAYLETASHNTFSEAKNIVKYTAERKYDALIVVSDKAHAFRCYLHAAQAMEAQGLIDRFHLGSIMSSAQNAEQTAGNCYALEPAHDNSNPMGDVVNKFWSLKKDEHKAATIAGFHEVVDTIKANT